MLKNCDDSNMVSSAIRCSATKKNHTDKKMHKILLNTTSATRRVARNYNRVGKQQPSFNI